jgi:hypothetical protein
MLVTSRQNRAYSSSSPMTYPMGEGSTTLLMSSQFSNDRNMIRYIFGCQDIHELVLVPLAIDLGKASINRGISEPKTDSASSITYEYNMLNIST